MAEERPNKRPRTASPPPIASTSTLPRPQESTNNASQPSQPILTDDELREIEEKSLEEKWRIYEMIQEEYHDSSFPPFPFLPPSPSSSSLNPKPFSNCSKNSNQRTPSRLSKNFHPLTRTRYRTNLFRILVETNSHFLPLIKPLENPFPTIPLDQDHTNSKTERRNQRSKENFRG